MNPITAALEQSMAPDLIDTDGLQYTHLIFLGNRGLPAIKVEDVYYFWATGEKVLDLQCYRLELPRDRKEFSYSFSDIKSLDETAP